MPAASVAKKKQKNSPFSFLLNNINTNTNTKYIFYNLLPTLIAQRQIQRHNYQWMDHLNKCFMPFAIVFQNCMQHFNFTHRADDMPFLCTGMHSLYVFMGFGKKMCACIRCAHPPLPAQVLCARHFISLALQMDAE